MRPTGGELGVGVGESSPFDKVGVGASDLDCVDSGTAFVLAGDGIAVSVAGANVQLVILITNHTITISERKRNLAKNNSNVSSQYFG